MQMTMKDEKEGAGKLTYAEIKLKKV